MSLVNSYVSDLGILRARMPGDLIATNELIAAGPVTVGNGTLLAANFAAGIITRTGPTAGYTDTTDTAANICAAIAASAGLPAIGSIMPGATFRFRLINSVAFLLTMAAGVGVTLGSNVNVAASSVKEYLISILNGTPLSVQAATLDGTTAVITGMTQRQTDQVSAGQLVSGTGITAGTTVLSVQSGTGVTLSAVTTAAGSAVQVTFSPRLRIDSLGQMLL